MRTKQELLLILFLFCAVLESISCRLLGALCRCICDPQLNAVSQEIRPAESLGQLLLFHLNSKSALQHITVALVLCKWAALQKVTRFSFIYCSVFYFFGNEKNWAFRGIFLSLPICLSGLSGGVIYGAASSSGHSVRAVIL